MNNKIIIIITILITIVLIVGGAYILFKDQKNNQGGHQDIPNRGENSNETIEASVKDVSSTVITYAEELTPTTKFKLKKGDRFIYKEPVGDGKIQIVYDFSIEDEEYIEGKRCYRILLNETRYIQDNEGFINSSSRDIFQDKGVAISSRVLTFYVDKEYGSVVMTKWDIGEGIISLKGESASAIVNGMSAQGELFYAPWMLALTRNFKWEQHTGIKYAVGETQNSIIAFEVIDVENIKGRECFKVEATEVSEYEGLRERFEQKTTLWIDLEKRILIKRENWVGNLRTGEMNLVSEINFS